MRMSGNDSSILLEPEFFLAQRRNPGWQQQSLRQLEGNNHFAHATISPDIHITQSHCSLHQDYHCDIQHPSATTLIFYGEQGISHFQIEGHNQYHTVRAGDLWLLNLQHSQLKRVTPKGQDCRLRVVKYNSQRIDQALTDLAPHHAGIRAVRLARQIAPPACFQRLSQSPLLSATERLLAEAFTLELLASYLDTLLPETHVSSHPGLSPELKKAQEILTADLTSPPGLQQLAQQLGMSHARLNREFRKHYGQTAFNWLRQYRLQQACHRLRCQQQNITDIALQLGYASASHFATSFRKAFGCTPQQYRQRQ